MLTLDTHSPILPDIQQELADKMDKMFSVCSSNGADMLRLNAEYAHNELSFSRSKSNPPQ